MEPIGRTVGNVPGMCEDKLGHTRPLKICRRNEGSSVIRMRRRAMDGIDQRLITSAQTLSTPLMCTQMWFYALRRTAKRMALRTKDCERLVATDVWSMMKIRLCWFVKMSSPSGVAKRQCMRSIVEMIAEASFIQVQQPKANQ